MNDNVGPFIITCIIVIAMFVGIAVAQPTGTNTVPGNVAPAVTFAGLPTKVTGTIAYVTDGATGNCGDGTCTTFGTAVTGGGGTLKLLVWWDGTGWTLIGK